MSDNTELAVELQQEEVTVVRRYEVRNAPILHHVMYGDFRPERAELTFVWWGHHGWRLTHAKAQGWSESGPGQRARMVELDFRTVGLPDSVYARPGWLNDLVNQTSQELAKYLVAGG